jgi:hypothetical protein
MAHSTKIQEANHPAQKKPVSAVSDRGWSTQEAVQTSLLGVAVQEAHDVPVLGLNHSRWPQSAQRQSLVSQIGKIRGNDALQRELSESFIPSPPMLIQRNPDPDPVWNQPFEAGTARDREQARMGVLRLMIRLHNLEADCDRENWDGEAQEQFSLLLDEGRSYTGLFESGGALTTGDVSNLTGYGQEVTQFYNARLGELRARMQRAVQPLTEAPTADTEQMENDLAEALHNAFIEGSDDRIGPIRDAIDKIKGYNRRVQQVLSYASDIAGRIRMARTAEALSALSGRAGTLGGVINRVSQVINAARAITTLTGIDNQAAGEAQNSLNQFEAGLNAIDVAMSFASGIPLIGTLWSRYYYPVARACIRMLRVIARMEDVQGRQLSLVEWMGQPRPAGRPPTIPEGLRRFFPGGQPVLDFMYAVVNDMNPVVTPAVDRFFASHTNLLNAGLRRGSRLETEGSRWYNPFSWGEEERTTNLLEFVQAQSDSVWSMLYGSLPHSLS